MDVHIRRAIVKVWAVGNPDSYRGTAFLITPDCLLTAAHVVSQYAPEQVVLENEAGERYTLANIQLHPDVAVDAALLWLASPLAEVQPIPLASQFTLLDYSEEVRMVGYALATEAGVDAVPKFEVLPLAVRGKDDEDGRGVITLHGYNAHGLSGGPVLKQGRLVGITDSRHRETNRSYFTPLYRFRDFLPDAVQKRELPVYDSERPLELPLAWVDTRYRSQFRLRQRIADFIRNYATRPDNPIPFVGRDLALQHLDSWLAQNERRLLILSGTAGRGKSALLLHWLARVLNSSPGEGPGVRVETKLLFLPLSIRFSTAAEMDGLRLLHSALCDDFSEVEFPPQARPDSDDYRDKLALGWEEMKKHPQQRWLLVVDALDEAINQWILREVLPREIPPNLHVLVSTRPELFEGPQAAPFPYPEPVEGRGNGAAWTSLELDTLAQSAMAEAVIQLGHPLDQLADKEDFTAELYRLTDHGDPLLLYLWIATTWKEHQSHPDLNAQALKALKPGFAGFFSRWLQDQQSVWQAENLAASRLEFERLSGQFESLLHVLAVAFAPLQIETELTPLLRQLRHPWGTDDYTLRAMLKAASRLLAVSGEGEELRVTLIHPRLRDYFREELETIYPKRLAEITQAFLEWGADTVAQLNSGELLAESCPAYLLRYYVIHVADADLPLVQKLEKYASLLNIKWYLAWEYKIQENFISGFIGNIKFVLELAENYNKYHSEHNELKKLRLAIEVRCALIVSRISQEISSDEIIKMVATGEWSLRYAETIIKKFDDTLQAVNCIDKLLEVVPNKNEIDRLKNLSLQIATGEFHGY